MRLLVTGAHGFIASHFIKKVLATTDWTVLGHNRNSNQKNKLRLPQENPERFSMVYGDLSENVSSLCERIDVVVNFAALSFVDHSIKDPKAFLYNNVTGTLNLLEDARRYGVGRFIHISTDEVYGSIDQGSHTEESPLAPGNPYSASKAAADMWCLSYMNTYKMPITITRCENCYGIYQHLQKLIPAFVSRALTDQSLPVYGDGLHKRMWLHVEDKADAIITIINKGTTGIYNIAGEDEHTNIEMTKSILSILNKPESLIKYIPDEKARPGHDRRYSIDSSKLRKLGWSPKRSIATHLKDTVIWYKENPLWTRG